MTSRSDQWAQALDGAAHGAALVDVDGRWLAVNAVMCRMLGRPETEVLAGGSPLVTHPEDLETDRDHAQCLLDGMLDGYEIAKRYVRPDGAVVVGQLNVSLARDARGAATHFVHQIRDVTAETEQAAELERHTGAIVAQAARDPLTGLLDRRQFEAALTLDLARAGAAGQCSVALLDLVGFDQLLEHNPDEADRLMLATTESIRLNTRARDLTARFGPGQFALGLSGTDHAHAHVIVHRIRAEVERGPGSLSYGLATSPADGRTTDLLLLRSDLRLGDARRRDRVGRAPLRTPQNRSHTVEETAREIVAIAHRHLGMDMTYFAEIADGTQVLRTICGDSASFGIAPGAVIPLEQSYCDVVLRGLAPNAVPDVSAHSALNSLAATSTGRIGCYIGVPVQLEGGQLHGTLCALAHEPASEALEEELDIMRSLAELLARQIDRVAFEASDLLAEGEFAGVSALVCALEARDHYTGEHSKVVVELVARVAAELRLSPSQTRDAELVALLHDIGKVGVSDAILQKDGPLDTAEWAVMRQHPAIGARILAGIPSLAHLAAAIKAEHERYDGHGYPDGLAGEAIPLVSRITFVCDAYHAMTSDRPYRRAIAPTAACAELRRGAGSQFDPDVVEALLAALPVTDR